MAQGLAALDPKASPPLPPAWEQRMRQLLTSEPNKSRILALQRPLEACRGDLLAALNAVLDRAAIGVGGAGGEVAGPSELLPTAPGQPGAGGSGNCGAAGAGGADAAVAMEIDGAPGAGGGATMTVQQQQQQQQLPRYIAIAAVDPAPLRAAAEQLLPPQIADKLKPELHATIWHSEDLQTGSDHDLRDRLVRAIGSQVLFEVVGVDTCAEVTAAQVRVGAVLGGGVVDCF